MADEARLHFCVDRMRQRSYREDLVDASGIPPQSRQTRSAEADALRATLPAPLNNRRSIAHVHAISAFDFSHALRCRRHATSTLVVMGAPAPRRRALGALHRITNVGSEFRCAYGVRRACGSEAGADFDHALSGTARRRRGIHNRSGHRGHPPPCRDDGLYRCRDVPGAVPGFRVATVPRKRSLPEPANGSTLPTMVGAVIYVRVSTKEQTENLSLPTQLRACEECCRQGYEVLERFHEEGESAKSTDRSQLQNLLTYCRLNKGRVHFVVVFNLTRFARDKYDHFALRSHLQSLGISLRSATEPIDDTSTGKLMEGVLAAVAQFDNDVRSDRTRAGMRAALELGRWTFPAPIGYLNAPKWSGKSLI